MLCYELLARGGRQLGLELEDLLLLQLTHLGKGKSDEEKQRCKVFPPESRWLALPLTCPDWLPRLVEGTQIGWKRFVHIKIYESSEKFYV